MNVQSKLTKKNINNKVLTFQKSINKNLKSKIDLSREKRIENKLKYRNTCKLAIHKNNRIK